MLKNLIKVFFTEVSASCGLIHMVTSRVLVAKRALVSVLRVLAALYTVVLKVNREASDADVLKAYRRVILKAHPDKGGATDAGWLWGGPEGITTECRGRRPENLAPS